jgi:hypothetical protein
MKIEKKKKIRINNQKGRKSEEKRASEKLPCKKEAIMSILGNFSLNGDCLARS